MDDVTHKQCEWCECMHAYHHRSVRPPGACMTLHVRYLPDSVLWRQKEQFSDGVGYSWIDSLKAEAESKVSDAEFSAAEHRFTHNTPHTKEAYYIREIFDRLFPHKSAALTVPGGPSIACSTAAAVEWDESFKKFGQGGEASGRSVGVHNDAYKK
eukprot:m.103121 g.103121  ORF g.103121 m.103121 type:complete len:155 (-) comp10467_c0_seq1:38-502(-)